MRNSIIYIIAIATIMLTGCDEGRIYDYSSVDSVSGSTASLSATVKGTGKWGDGYTLALAGFAEDNEYALISKNVSVDENSSCEAQLEGIPSAVMTVEFCIIDRLRRKVTSFISKPYTGSDVELSGTGVDITMAGTIQREIFNTTCVQCHGNASYAAASLHLTEGESFSQLIGIPSVKEDGKNRVAPGNADESVLYRILSTDESASWSYDHSVEVVSDLSLNLIRSWINEGADVKN